MTEGLYTADQNRLPRRHSYTTWVGVRSNFGKTQSWCIPARSSEQTVAQPHFQRFKIPLIHKNLGYAGHQLEYSYFRDMTCLPIAGRGKPIDGALEQKERWATPAMDYNPSQVLAPVTSRFMPQHILQVLQPHCTTRDAE